MRRKNSKGLPAVGTVAHRLRIGERDGWICGLCKKPINPSVSVYESDWAATIDHIIPRARGGTHDDDNLQIAHLKCNQVKSTTLATSTYGPLPWQQSLPWAAWLEELDGIPGADFLPVPAITLEDETEKIAARCSLCGVTVGVSSPWRRSFGWCVWCHTRFCPGCRDKDPDHGLRCYREHRGK